MPREVVRRCHRAVVEFDRDTRRHRLAPGKSRTDALKSRGTTWSVPGERQNLQIGSDKHAVRGLATVEAPRAPLLTWTDWIARMSHDLWERNGRIVEFLIPVQPSDAAD